MCDVQVTVWLRNHPGRPVAERDLAEIFGIAYGKAATVVNAQSAFQKTGLNPYNPEIFTVEDFVSCNVTEILDYAAENTGEYTLFTL